MFRYVLIEIYHKIKAEIKDLSSERPYFILRDTVEAVKRFHWDTVLMEFEKMLPTFLILLKNLIHIQPEYKPLMCLIASQRLKPQDQKMDLVQQEISIMLYKHCVYTHTHN